MNADGSDLKQLTDNAFGDYYPVWSPTEKIASIPIGMGTRALHHERGRVGQVRVLK